MTNTEKKTRRLSRDVSLTMNSIVEGLGCARVWMLAVLHFVLFTATYWGAFLLRFDFHVPASMTQLFLTSLPWFVGVKIVIFYLSGHFHGWWRYVTFSDLTALLRAAVLSVLFLGMIDYVLVGSYQVPRTVLILDMLLTVILVGSLRASWRLVREQSRALFGCNDRPWALMVGTDDSAAMLAHQIQSHPESQFSIRGFLELNGQSIRGRRIGQIPVIGHVNDLARVAAKCDIRDVLVVAGSLPGEKLRNLMKTCQESHLNLKIIPPAEDLFTGDHAVPTRDIEISDLLHRDPVKLDATAIERLVKGRTVLVTGAGGSIGSEICRQLIPFQPAALVLVGRGENRIFQIEHELNGTVGSTRLVTVIADVTNPDRMRQVFSSQRPDVVFHAAAHKHVPLMEANVGEAIRNNVGGTRCLADLADEFSVDAFVMISTDKAVHPTSVMGATKHMAERYVHALSQESKTRFMVTRFGNVLGSNGSVVPIFQEQIRRGGPITVTHADMTRFFMTIPEASQLVLQAAAMGKGGEIFVLEMGKPVRIVDLARDLIRLSGLPEDAIEVCVTGARPGEKLYEELYFDGESTLPTSHPKLRVAYHRLTLIEEVRDQIDELFTQSYASNTTAREALNNVVQEFKPSAAAALN